MPNYKGVPENLKPFVKGDKRICKHPPGRPRKLMNILDEFLKLDPKELISTKDPKTLELIKRLKKKKLIRDTKDLLAIRIVMRALRGDWKAIDLIIKQIGEDTPVKIDINTELKKVGDLTDEQLEAIAAGYATFQDFAGQHTESESSSDAGIEAEEKSEL